MAPLAFDNVEDAVRGAERIHVTLSDDDAVDQVLQQASPGFSPGAIIIDHTTTSAPGAAARSAYWKRKGNPYIHAPVFMGPLNALSQYRYYVGFGRPEIIKKLEPRIKRMTGKLWNCVNNRKKPLQLNYSEIYFI